MQRLATARVLVVGVGGVGSWCAEALIRTGLGHLTIMDDDVIATSNLNRQCPATVETIGQPKVEAMAKRLKSISPEADIVALNRRFTGEDAAFDYDLIVDAIDSVDCKAALILGAQKAGVPIISSMGAALRIDPTKIVVTRFDKVEGDGLAKALRNRFKRLNNFPKGNFRCVWSKEPPHSAGGNILDSPRSRGSIMPVTCAFGMALAAETLNAILTA